MFRVIQLFVFVFVFGRIVHRTIRIRSNSLKPLFSTSLVIVHESACIPIAAIHTNTSLIREQVTCKLYE